MFFLSSPDESSSFSSGSSVVANVVVVAAVVDAGRLVVTAGRFSDSLSTGPSMQHFMLGEGH